VKTIPHRGKAGSGGDRAAPRVSLEDGHDPMEVAVSCSPDIPMDLIAASGSMRDH
jgi:hypothetical protein